VLPRATLLLGNLLKLSQIHVITSGVKHKA
jgi:hypothetical protein